jgi:hypothetical protein
MGSRGKWRRLLSWRMLTLSVVVAGVGAGAFFVGRNGAMSQANAQGRAVTAAPTPEPAPQPPMPPGPAMSNAYTRNVVAYIYGTVPITREELGEYLIARFGAERLETFVNKRIIEHHCQRQGITVTAQEVEADLAETLKSFGGAGITREVFEKQVLKARGKTLYEWKEDVIRPKLLMSKLCRDRVRVEDMDLKRGYEAYHGEKVKVQMIVWPKNEKHVADQMWGVIRKDAKAFDKAAREQADVTLARVGGMINPFGRHTTGSPKLEEMAFEKLDVGDVSPVMEAPQGGYVVIKLLERIPPEKSAKLEDVRAKLEKEIIEKKIQIEIPIVFEELKKQADPRLLLRKNITQEELEREVQRELQSSGARVPLPEPVGNVREPLAPKPR